MALTFYTTMISDICLQSQISNIQC